MSISSSPDAQERSPPFGSPSFLLDLPSAVTNSPSLYRTALATPSTLNRPLPPLPTELKREVLRFCDQHTLAKTSAVSLAFLQLSSPLLYRDIIIRGYKGLERLFCRSKDWQDSITPYLDVRQIQSIRFVMGSEDREIKSSKKLKLEPDRLYPPSSPPSTVQALLSSVEVVFIEIDPELDDNEDLFALSVLFGLLDPVHIFVEGRCSTSDDPEDAFVWLDGGWTNPWSRVGSIVLKNAAMLGYLRTSVFENTVRPFVVTYDLADVWPWTSDEDAALLEHAGWDLFGIDPSDWGIDVRDSLLDHPFLSRVVLRVTNRQQTDAVARWARLLLEELETGGLVGETRVKWAGKLEFEELDTGTRRLLSSME